MLVAIAIITVLLSLVIVTLNGVRSTAKNAHCQANLAQLAQAALRYANDHSDWPTAIAWRIPAVGELEQTSWDWVTKTTNFSQTPQRIRAGSLWNYADQPQKLYQCPACEDQDLQSDQMTGYNYNTTFIGGEMAFAPPSFAYTYRGIRPSQCQRTAKCALFGDAGRGGPEAPLNNYMRAPTGNRPAQPHLGPGQHVVGLDLIYTGGQAFRHKGATNIAHLDGHTSGLNVPFLGERWEDAPTSIQSLLDYPNDGFLSNDDRLYNPNWSSATATTP